jgi:hypothetical protein
MQQEHCQFQELYYKAPSRNRDPAQHQLGRTAIADKSILPANINQALAIFRDYDFDTDFLLTSLTGQVLKDFVRKNPAEARWIYQR